jgi:dopamine beta-monooxygenase
MYGTAVAIFLVILVAALRGSEPPESPFPYHIPLDPEGILELSWNVSYVQEIIHFQLQVQGLRAGVLFGMSDRGEMENADLIMLWTDGDRAYFAVSPLPSFCLVLTSIPPPHTHTQAG